MRTLLVALLCALLWTPRPGRAGEPPSLRLEALSWTELREQIAAGRSTVLLPIGGIEQSGPHLALGKHNRRAAVLAERIAQRLGNALVAPVIAYVPEGGIDPPSGHMRWPGTVSVPVEAFEATLEHAARSFKRHGFRDVIFLGDHGDYQRSEERVAQRLNRAWATEPGCRVHALREYYDAAQGAYVAALKARGFGPAEIGEHAGLADTALALAVDPALLRAAPKPATPGDGVRGDPTRASAALGQLGVDAIVDASVAAIQARTAARR
ncbi:MAG TPA: creatininase family protein [Methylibium sp.]|nr:creatininase family protein [Methylibium sp.]